MAFQQPWSPVGNSSTNFSRDCSPLLNQTADSVKLKNCGGLSNVQKCDVTNGAATLFLDVFVVWAVKTAEHRILQHETAMVSSKVTSQWSKPHKHKNSDRKNPQINHLYMSEWNLVSASHIFQVFFRGLAREGNSHVSQNATPTMRWNSRLGIDRPTNRWNMHILRQSWLQMYQAMRLCSC